jgi:hypothetical protein
MRFTLPVLSVLAAVSLAAPNDMIIARAPCDDVSVANLITCISNISGGVAPGLQGCLQEQKAAVSRLCLYLPGIKPNYGNPLFWWKLYIILRIFLSYI